MSDDTGLVTSAQRVATAGAESSYLDGLAAQIHQTRLKTVPRLDPQQRGHRWSGRYLPGADAKPALAVSQDEPGSPFATKLAIAIEEQLVLGSVGHGCKDS